MEPIIYAVLEVALTLGMELVIPSGIFHQSESRIKQVFQGISLLGLGFLSGLLSLAILPRSAIHNPGFRVIFLAFLTLSGGAVAAAIGYFRKKSSRSLKVIFFHGMLFVLGMGLIRLFRAE